MVQKVAWSDYVTLSPMAANVSAARGFVQDLLIDHDLLYLVEDVRLVTSELATNASRHAKTSYTVLLEGLSDSIRLTVTHDLRSRPVLTTLPVMATAGRGANIVGYYSREWGVNEGRQNAKSVWASFDLRPTRGPRTSLVPGGHQHTGTEQGDPMAEAETSTVPSRSRLLSDFRREVQLARARLRGTRSGGHANVAQGAQAHFVASLTEYVEALTLLRLPVPYALRDELRLYGGTVAAHNASRPGRR
jgi:hypothetical protein